MQISDYSDHFVRQENENIPFLLTEPVNLDLSFVYRGSLKLANESRTSPFLRPPLFNYPPFAPCEDLAIKVLYPSLF